MQSSPDRLAGTKNGRALTSPPLDSSFEDIDELFIDQVLDNLDDDDIPCAPAKHFLDYDSIPPPGFEDDDDDCSSTVAVKGVPRNGVTTVNANVYPNEDRKVDKKYETDGEISDFELAAANGNKRHRDKTTIIIDADRPSSSGHHQPLFVKNTGARRKKHFLDENPIPPDYEMDCEREHRSLDRNFERTKDYDIKFERKHSLDRERPKRVKETSFTMARFLEHEPMPVHRGTWPADRPNDTQYAGDFSSMPPGEHKNLGPMGPKVECVYSLLSMLGCNDQQGMSRKFLDLSKTPETCAALRHSRCIPLIVQMIHSDADEETRKRASQALHNVVNRHPDDKAGRRESKVLRHIEQIMEYCETLKTMTTNGEVMADDTDRHPLQAICSLMKISFDEEHRHAMCQLGALQAIASMVHYDHAVHGANSSDERCHSLRRYAGMALTNLTFGDGNNKALLCTNKDFMRALVAQLNSDADDLLQVTASVLRNLSWRADNAMKHVLNEIGTVTALTHVVMRNKNENTIKALLSALWNLSAHCSTNKAEFCAVDGALAFLVDMLVYEGPSKTMSIIENSGGILRNVSSHIAVKEAYRVILRQRNCLGILLQQLSSESLTIVSNACGTLWNLSARCAEDQKFLLDSKAVPMLSLLINSKHNMISNGSSAALKNLLNFRPGGVPHGNIDPIAKSMRLKELPSLNARKLRALEQDLDQNLSETCENIEITTPPKEHKSIDDFLKLDASRPYQATTAAVVSMPPARLTKSAGVPKSSDSQDAASVVMATAKSSDLCFASGTQTSSNRMNNTRRQDDERASKSNAPTPAPRSSIKKSDDSESGREDSGSPSTYQETDLDQITDFSLRYGENQNYESDTDDVKPVSSTDAFGNEILLILEDSVKCYETEGTPYVISNAASVSDLRATIAGASGSSAVVADTKVAKPFAIKNKVVKSGHVTNENSGINTPEKTTNYCEEGTPGYSIYDSYSSLEEAGADEPSAAPANDTQRNAPLFNDTIHEELVAEDDGLQQQQQHPEGLESGSGTNPTTPGGSNAKVVTFETPMMFSRQSSMGSLSSVEPAMADDRSSVVSDFSRLASGIISPSEIPDSPSQMISHSPRRHANGGGVMLAFPTTPPVLSYGGPSRLRSVFEDDVNTFDVENTPAQFSCATSLSNLSLDDEPKIATDSLTKEMRLINHPSEEQEDGLPIPIEHGDHIEDVGRTTGTTSDSDETDDDNMLLETCINIGMNSGVRAAPPKSSSSSPVVMVVRSGVENHMVTAVLSDDSTSGSDVGNDSMMEQCIREGIQRSTASKPKPKIPDQPNQTIEVSLPEYQRSTSHFKPQNYMQNQLDDSLSSLSMDSEDDGLILRQAIAAGSQGKPKTLPIVKPPAMLPPQQRQPPSSVFTTVAPLYPPQPRTTHVSQPLAVPMGADGNDSISSIDSTDSNDTQHASLLEQCIQSGMHKQNKPVTKPRSLVTATTPAKPSVAAATGSPKRSQLPTFKSPSQLERDRQKERERKDEALLMECIQTGMSKARPSDTQIRPPVRHARQVLAPTDFTQRMANMNINDAVQNHNQSHHHTPHHQHLMSQHMSKNGETTSVAVSDTTLVASAPYTAPGVVETTRPIADGTNESRNARSALLLVSSPNFTTNPLQDPTTTPPPPTILMPTIKTGSSQSHQQTVNGLLQVSHGSMNLSNNDGLADLDRSNEYPAMRLSHIEYGDSPDDNDGTTIDMEVSNEFLMDSYMDETESIAYKMDKHKDPDLMLKSVDRLTQELVSTAEYLRTTTASNSEAETTVYERKSSSNSNNTWNEDTCPNDASFPSISMTAPMIASMNDDDATLSEVYMPKVELCKADELEEATPTNEARSFIISGAVQPPSYQSIDFDIDGTSQPESLDTTDSRTLMNDDDPSTSSSQINFQVGGEVQHSFRDAVPAYLSSGPFSFDTASAMTNSTIIALEANKLVTELLNMQTMADSSTSLDLDHIRPPSGMDTVSISGYYESTAAAAAGTGYGSPQLSRSRKKSLPLGLMARRALSHAVPSGSLESVHSSCNMLDNIKPPSIMDELLDSMISVASITSEVMDQQQSNNDHSTYDTALSEMEDSTTLRSCYDLPNDATPIPSDFSSAESTPKKMRSVKRAMTPKQKRQMVKDRYRTYTIAADMMISDCMENDDKNDNDVDAAINGCRSDGDGADDTIAEDMIQIEIVEDPKRLTPRQRRNEDRLRFQTQVLDPVNIVAVNGSPDAAEAQCDPNEDFRRRTFNSQDEDETLADNRPFPRLFKFTDTSSDSTSLDDDADMSSIRALTNRFNHIRDVGNYVAPPTPPSSAVSLKNGPPTFTTTNDSDINSLDFEQNSETESCYQNHCIDEETYTLASPPPPKAKPKIVKPTAMHTVAAAATLTAETTVEPNEAKAIRGKKKAAYVSPYKKTFNASVNPSRPSVLPKTTPPSPDSAASKKTTIASRLVPRNQPIVAKTHVLLNRSNLTNKINTVRTGITRPGFSAGSNKSVADKNQLNRLTVPKSAPATKLVMPPTPSVPPAMPERQGTFVKDEPTIPDGVPVVTSAPASPARSRLPSKLPASTVGTPTSPAKTSGFVSKLKNPLQRSASIGAGGGASAKTVTPKLSARPVTTPSASTNGLNELHKRRSAGGAFYRSPSTPTVPQRSNSNASIKSSIGKREPFSTQPPSRSNSNLTPPAVKTTTNITSRIAGLWKKPDQTVAKQPVKVAANVATKPPSGNRLIRSSTFDNSPDKVTTTNNNNKSNAAPVKPPIKDGVVRRIKVVATKGGASNDETKRISRLGSFINVEETAA